MSRFSKFTVLALVVILVVGLLSVSLMAGCNKPAGTSGGAATAGAVYTCPMHPEVTSPKPGTCPKCKMDLVKKG